MRLVSTKLFYMPKKKLKVAQVRDLLNQVYNEKISFSRFVEILNEYGSEKDPKELIATIKVNAANLDYIKQTGKINGSLAVDIERVMREYAS